MKKEDHNKVLNWIQLINTDGIGPVTFYKLLKEHKGIDNALDYLKSSTRYQLFPRDKACLEFDLAQSKKIEIILKDDARYPKNLKKLQTTIYLSNPLGISLYHFLNHNRAKSCR